MPKQPFPCTLTTPNPEPRTLSTRTPLSLTARKAKLLLFKLFKEVLVQLLLNGILAALGLR